MDQATIERLIERTAVEPSGDDWSAIDAIWRPYIEQGDIEAQYRLPCYYFDYVFEEVPKIRSEMEALLRTAAERNHPEAVYRLSQMCKEEVERDALLLRAGELGNSEAQRDLGACYGSGDWTGPKDPVRAVEWYRRAADRGHAGARYELGGMYLEGDGCSVDTEEGMHLLRLAAGQGDLSASRLLADVYGNGYYGVPVDAAEAERWEALYRESDELLMKKLKSKGCRLLSGPEPVDGSS